MLLGYELVLGARWFGYELGYYRDVRISKF